MNEQDLTNFGILSPATSSSSLSDSKKVAEDFIAVSNLQKKRRNNLLGSFDLNGKYFIKDVAILNALIQLPKKFESKEDNVVYATIKLEEFVLNFKIVFEISPSFCNAYLYFIEIEHSLEEDKKHTTLLDSVLDVYSPQFKEGIYSLWKVYLEEDVYEKDDYLLNLLKSQKEEYEFSQELVEILSQLYLMRMLKALENCGELGETIKKEYNEIVEKLLAEAPGLAQNNIRLKFVLDSLIEKHKALDDIMKTQEGVAVISGYVNPMIRILYPQTIVQQTGNKPIEKAKEDKKTSKQISKPKGKIKGGGSKSKPVKPFDIGSVFGGKKKEAKKDDKKKLFVGPGKNLVQPTVPNKIPEKSIAMPEKPQNDKVLDDKVLEALLAKASLIENKQKTVSTKDEEKKLISEKDKYNNKTLQTYIEK